MKQITRDFNLQLKHSKKNLRTQTTKKNKFLKFIDSKKKKKYIYIYFFFLFN